MYSQILENRLSVTHLINYKTDFLLYLSFEDLRTTQFPWNVVFFTIQNDKKRSENIFEASFDGQKLKNCHVSDEDNKVIIFELKSHNLPCGRLFYEVNWTIPNPIFTGHRQNKNYTIPTDYILWPGPSENIDIAAEAYAILAQTIQGADGPAGKDGAPGAPGLPGRDGHTPYIGENGNWWIEGVDTGKPSQGIGNERLVLSATLGASGANWPVELTSPLSEVQAAYESFRDAPDRHNWSVVLRDASGAFIEAVGLEPFAVVGGLELLFTSQKSGKRYAVVLTVTDGAATAARVEYRYREDQQKYLDATANFPADLRVKFNTATGCWELSGLTDISDSEMAEIYNVSHPRQNSPYLTNAFMSYHIRTNLPITAWDGLGGYMTQLKGCQLDGAFTENKRVEIVNLGVGVHVGGLYSTFLKCASLRKIIGRMWFGQTTAANIYRAFIGCSALEEVDLRYLGAFSISLEDSPLLSLETGRNMVKYAFPKVAITITLHPEAYARWTADAELVAAAREKQFAFATTTVANSLLLDEGGEGIRIETTGENAEMVAPPGWYITQADEISDYDRIYVSRRILLPAESIGNWRTAKASEKAELEARIDEEQPDNRETYA